MTKTPRHNVLSRFQWRKCTLLYFESLFATCSVERKQLFCSDATITVYNWTAPFECHCLLTFSLHRLEQWRVANKVKANGTSSLESYLALCHLIKITKNNKTETIFFIGIQKWNNCNNPDKSVIQVDTGGISKPPTFWRYTVWHTFLVNPMHTKMPCVKTANLTFWNQVLVNLAVIKLRFTFHNVL